VDRILGWLNFWFTSQPGAATGYPVLPVTLEKWEFTKWPIQKSLIIKLVPKKGLEVPSFLQITDSQGR
jgi:hypothetical protein